MPIIRSHHKKDRELAHAEPFWPTEPWPDDCTVQWGRGGIVLSTSDAPRRTAFFEAFPGNGGFIRGEGPSVAEAERAAHRQLVKEDACDHRWSRGKYLNGGTLCRKCNAFKTTMKEVVILGAWRRPLSATSLSFLAEGWILPVGDPESRRHARRTWLRARYAGITDLPPLFEAGETDPENTAEYRAYVVTWEKAVARFLRERKRTSVARDPLSSVTSLFDSISEASLAELTRSNPVASADQDEDEAIDHTKGASGQPA